MVTSGTVPPLPIDENMDTDLALGFAALAIGTLLVAFSAPLAHLMQEADDHYRERFPWAQAYEPQTGRLATATGRWWILRSWLLLSAVGFVGMGLALAARGAV